MMGSVPLLGTVDQVPFMTLSDRGIGDWTTLPGSPGALHTVVLIRGPLTGYKEEFCSRGLKAEPGILPPRCSAPVQGRSAPSPSPQPGERRGGSTAAGPIRLRRGGAGSGGPEAGFVKPATLSISPTPKGTFRASFHGPVGCGMQRPTLFFQEEPHTPGFLPLCSSVPLLCQVSPGVALLMLPPGVLTLPPTSALPLQAPSCRPRPLGVRGLQVSSGFPHCPTPSPPGSNIHSLSCSYPKPGVPPQLSLSLSLCTAGASKPLWLSAPQIFTLLPFSALPSREPLSAAQKATLQCLYHGTTRVTFLLKKCTSVNPMKPAP